jgi:hypothetical protein
MEDNLITDQEVSPFGIDTGCDGIKIKASGDGWKLRCESRMNTVQQGNDNPYMPYLRVATADIKLSYKKDVLSSNKDIDPLCFKKKHVFKIECQKMMGHFVSDPKRPFIVICRCITCSSINNYKFSNIGLTLVGKSVTVTCTRK